MAMKSIPITFGDIKISRRTIYPVSKHFLEFPNGNQVAIHCLFDKIMLLFRQEYFTEKCFFA